MNNYFPHDSNARNSDKLIPLRAKHGAEGYGVYFMILERLREEPTYMSVKDYNMLAFDLRVDAALLKAVVEDFGLFVFTDDGKYFYSEGFLKRMKAKDEKSEKNRESARKRWTKARNKCESDAPASENDCERSANADADAYASKVKETKVKETKEKKRRLKESEGEKSISLSSSRDREEQKRERIFNFFLFQKKLRNADAERQRFQDVYVSSIETWSMEQLDAKLRLWEVKTQGKTISAPPEFWQMWRTVYDFCVGKSIIGDYTAFAEINSVEYIEHTHRFRVNCSARLSKFMRGAPSVRELWTNGTIEVGLQLPK